MPGFVPVGGGPVGADAEVIVIVTNARVSQVVVEAVGTPAANARVSQTVVEAVGTPLANARVSQIVIEAVGYLIVPDAATGVPVLGGFAASGHITISKIATFTVTLSAASVETCSVSYATQSGTATSPTDFVAASGTLTFAPGTVTETIVVTILADPTANVDKSFTMLLSAPVNCVLPVPPSAMCVISTLTIG